MRKVEEPTSAGIKIRPSTKRKMDSIKVHPRETYDDVITRLIAHMERCNNRDGHGESSRVG